MNNLIINNDNADNNLPYALNDINNSDFKEKIEQSLEKAILEYVEENGKEFLAFLAQSFLKPTLFKLRDMYQDSIRYTYKA